MSPIEIFKAGGYLMYPLTLTSLITLAIIIERLVNLRESRVLNREFVGAVNGLIERGSTGSALQMCRENPGVYSNIVGAGLEIASHGEVRAKEAVEDAGRHETASLKRYLSALGTIAAVSPLIGLLGTVIGMIVVFRTIAESGGGQAAALSTGIFQALITTATGLLIAIPALIAHNFFQQRAETIIGGLERASLRALHHLYMRSKDDAVSS